MSGLEPLVAVGLACNVFQAISFGHEVIGVVKKIYRDGTLDNDVGDHADRLQDITTHLWATCAPTSKTVSAQEQQLLAIASKCHDIARDLREEINFLALNAGKGVLAAAIKTAAKANWRKRRLTRLADQLSSAEKLMQTGLLAQICDRALLLQLKTETIDNRLRDFLNQYQQGHKTAKTLIATQHAETRRHITTQSSKTQDLLRHHVTRELAESSTRMIREISANISHLQLEAARDTNRTRLLGSLKYNGMNERRSQVTGSYSKTFDWVFESPERTEQLESQILSDSSGIEEIIRTPEVAWDSFGEWLKSEETVYWVSGKPGSGKTTLINYMLFHPSTESSLKIWKDGTLIISHFFWRPGTYIQQSIRGMTLSLLYQLLVEAQPIALDAVLSNIKGALSKDSETDWSWDELRSAIELVLKVRDRPICMFIDGVDEIAPADSKTFDLISLIEEWIGLRPGYIKVCFSSRPELPIKQRLQVYPHLYLEKLTAVDLIRYADGNLREPFHSFSEDHCITRAQAIRSLVRKAEGVFLWLVLAVRSVNEGLENGDDSSDIQKRIGSLDGDLATLYHDMWTRANGASALYRKTTALFLKLVIASRDLVARAGFQINVLQMLLASSTTADEILDTEGAIFQPSVLKTRCESTERKVLMRSAGILQLSTSYASNDSSLSGNGSLGHYTRTAQIFTFIHRTAYEFLTDTSAGREILSHDTSSLVDVKYRLIKAQLATFRLFSTTKWAGKGYLFMSTMWHPGTPLNHVDLYLRRIRQLHDKTLKELWFVNRNLESDVAESQQELMVICQQLVRAGVLKCEYAHGIVRRFKVENWDLFCGASLCGLDGYIYSGYLSRPLKSQILLNLVKAGGLGQTDPLAYSLGTLDLTREWVETGANPNYVSSFFRRTETEFFLATPFTAFLANSLHTPEIGTKSTLDAIWRTLVSLVEAGANLEDNLCLAFQPFRPVRDEKRDANLEMNISMIFVDIELVNRSRIRGFYCYGVVAIKAIDVVRILSRALQMLDPSIPTDSGPDKLIRALGQDTSPQPAGRVIAVVQLADTCQALNHAYRETLLQDSDCLLDAIWGNFPNLWDDKSRSAFDNMFQQAFDRGTPRDEGIADLLIRHGFLTRDVYDGDQEVENPWKR